MGDIRATIARNIREYRLQMGLSQRELANMLNVSYSSVANWELGSNSPNIEILMDICKVFKINLPTMYGVSENEEAEAQTLYRAYKAAPQHIRSAIDSLLNKQQELLDPRPEEADKDK